MIPLMGTQTQEKQAVIIKFAGDSGDGMQLTGGLFTDDTAITGRLAGRPWRIR